MTGSTWTDPKTRPPLRLPPGSVRAVMSLIIGGIFWAILLFSSKSQQIPIHLYFLLALEMIFFIAHGKSITPKDEKTPGPLWLPRGTFRTIILLGFIGTVGYKIFENPEGFQQAFQLKPEHLKQFPWLLLSMGLGFVMGLAIKSGPWQRSPMFRDVQAWVAILAMVGLGIEIVYVAFIEPSLTTKVDLWVWRRILVGVVAAYFGIRS